MRIPRSIVLGFAAVALSCGADERRAGGQEDGHEEHGERETGRVTLPAEALSDSGIRVEPLQRQKLLGGVAVPAEVELNSERAAHVRTPVEGPISEVRASLGDRVRGGDVLAVVRSVAAGEARASLAEARARVEAARASLARQEELVRAGVGAERNRIDAQAELRTGEAELRAAAERTRLYGGSGSGTLIAAPLDGQVLERHATVGEMAHTDEELFLIGDLSTVWVIGHVYEQDVAAARTGVPARLTLDAYPGRVWEGTITYAAGRLDPETRTVEVRLELDNDGSLRPGLFGTLWLPAPGVDPARAVPALPEDAVQRIGGAEVVFVEVAPSTFEARPVRLGARGAGLVEVVSGVAEGTRVVVSGSFVLKSELRKGEVGGHEH